MENKWNKKVSAGQNPIGYIDIFETIADGIKVRAIVNYLPQFIDFQTDRTAHTTVFIESNINKISKGKLNGLYRDIAELVTLHEDQRFTPGTKSLKVINTQLITVDTLPEFNLISHGDYSLSED